MHKLLVGCVFAAALGLAGAASAQAGGGPPHSAMSSMASSHMASSAGHSKETKTDMMMVHNCQVMPRKKMLKDAECQDYMKHHPDWMKRK